MSTLISWESLALHSMSHLPLSRTQLLMHGGRKKRNCFFFYEQNISGILPDRMLHTTVNQALHMSNTFIENQIFFVYLTTFVHFTFKKKSKCQVFIFASPQKLCLLQNVLSPIKHVRSPPSYKPIFFLHEDHFIENQPYFHQSNTFSGT